MDIVLAELLGHVQAETAVFVIDVSLDGVTQDPVGLVDFLELENDGLC